MTHSLRPRPVTVAKGTCQSPGDFKRSNAPNKRQSEPAGEHPAQKTLRIALFTEYLTAEETEAELKNNSLFAGRIHMGQMYGNKAYVSSETHLKDIEIVNSGLNRAL
ncbi:hypothetical protein HDU98_007342 [Podochytrium sp. JEL0797]|nr:hypothetical protein HDU98_007342 [Podochytrium sp. JEL0797]